MVGIHRAMALFWGHDPSPPSEVVKGPYETAHIRYDTISTKSKVEYHMQPEFKIRLVIK